jgi:hypothetical protein
MKKLTKFGALLGSIFFKMRIYKYKTKIISDNPSHESIKRNVVYVVGNNDYVKWAYLKCPCGCNETIMLNLIESTAKPSWKVYQDYIGRPTINPSIHRIEGCCSHFYLRKGNVRWT